MRDSKKAFDWITSLLEELGHRYVVVGGLAANVFGGARPLNDIDLDVPKAALSQIAELARSYVTFGPERYQDQTFDIDLLSLRYAEQDIDLTAAETVSLFDKRTMQWQKLPTALDQFEMYELMGKIVPVMRKELLIGYKQMIARDTDLEDIEAMNAAPRLDPA